MSTEEDKSKERAHLIENRDRKGTHEQPQGAGKSSDESSTDQSEAAKPTVKGQSAAKEPIITERLGFVEERDVEENSATEQHKVPRQPEAEQSVPEQPSPDHTGPEKTGPEKTGPEKTGPEKTGPEQTGPEKTEAEQTRPEQTGPVQPDTEKPGQGQAEPEKSAVSEPEQPEPEQPGIAKPGKEQTEPERPGKEQTSLEPSEVERLAVELPEADKTEEEQPAIKQSEGVQDKSELPRADLPIPSYLGQDSQALAGVQASASHTGSSLSLLAEIASAETFHPSWRSDQIPSTSGYLSHPQHLPDTSEIDEATFLLKLERTFNEAELFYSDISSLGGSPIPFNVTEESDGEPAAKRRRAQLPKATFSSFDETTSSSSSSLHSPLLPSTISGLEDSPPHKLDINLGTTKFWKYRQIPKGPEGRTFNPQVQSPTDPTKPLEFRDPVFMETETAEGLTHFGKARTGEANDITPQPAKLARIGNIVRDIGKRMENMKEKSQEKEKAKLSSNHCRLRKIANNEANKIIFNGMEKEKGELTITLSRVREAIGSHELRDDKLPTSLITKVDTIMTECYHTKVAGQAGVYIDHILAEHGYTSE